MVRTHTAELVRGRSPDPPRSACVRLPVVLAFLVLPALALPAAGADWPQFRGPNRDGTSPETGLLPSWPDGGPPRVAALEGVGEGFSSPAVADGRVFVTGRVKDSTHVFCFDTSGERLWQTACGPEFTSMWPGSRSTPTCDDGRLYVLTGKGRLAALAAADGRQLWTIDLLKWFRAKLPMYGVAESVLVVGDLLVCLPGAPEAFAVALDKRTGRAVWAAKGVEGPIGYASAIVADHGGVRQIIALTNRGLVGLRAADGALLWQHAEGFGGLLAENVLTPIFAGGIVFGDGGHYGGGAAVRLQVQGAEVVPTLLWKKSAGSTHLGGYVERGGHLYGETGRGWSCVELATGTVRYKTREIRRAATLWADGRFYCLGEKGTMHLVEADPAAHRVVGEFEIPDAGSQTWAYPAISGGRLFIRRRDTVHVYDIAAGR